MSLLRFYQNLKRVGSTLKDGESLGNVVYRWYRNAGQLKAGRLVGADQFGNKYVVFTECDVGFTLCSRYYEDDSDNINSVTGRERWVEYVNHGARNASQVPPEWYVILSAQCSACVLHLCNLETNCNTGTLGYTSLVTPL